MFFLTAFPLYSVPTSLPCADVSCWSSLGFCCSISVTDRDLWQHLRILRFRPKRTNTRAFNVHVCLAFLETCSSPLTPSLTTGLFAFRRRFCNELSVGNILIPAVTDHQNCTSRSFVGCGGSAKCTGLVS